MALTYKNYYDSNGNIKNNYDSNGNLILREKKGITIHYNSTNNNAKKIHQISENEIEQLKDLPNLKAYILKVMERDIPEVRLEYRKQLADYVIDFILQIQKEGYVTNQNFSKCLKKIIKQLSNFQNITNPNELDTYAACSGDYIFKFQFGSRFAIENMKHLVFHELTHAITNHNIKAAGYYSELINNPNSRITTHTNNSDAHIHIIDDAMAAFIREIVAESTACELNGYNEQRRQTEPFGTSDWITPWNCSYQTLGYEFLKTLLDEPPTNEREVFKQFTKMTINSDKDICADILNVYQKKNPNNWKEELHKISEILGYLVYNHWLPENDVKRVRELMKKYTPTESRLTIHRITTYKR